MTLGEIINKAIATKNSTSTGRIVDTLRFKHGFTYLRCFDIFKRNAPNPKQFSASDFEDLMAEADTVEEGI